MERDTLRSIELLCWTWANSEFNAQSLGTKMKVALHCNRWQIYTLQPQKFYHKVKYRQSLNISHPRVLMHLFISQIVPQCRLSMRLPLNVHYLSGSLEFGGFQNSQRLKVFKQFISMDLCFTRYECLLDKGYKEKDTLRFVSFFGFSLQMNWFYFNKKLMDPCFTISFLSISIFIKILFKLLIFYFILF